MAHHSVGKLVFSINVSAEAMARMSDAFKRAGEIMRRVAKELARERLDLYRSAWWQRGEGEPEYLADLHEPEWWNEGGEPPWGCAA